MFITGGDILILLIIVIIVGCIIGATNDINNTTVYTTCEWCGKEIKMRNKEYKMKIKRGVPIYCCGRCRRADESSRGVKEKRIRYIDHE